MSKPKVKFSQSKPGTSGVSRKKFQIPALSVPIKQPPLDPVLERLKKKVVRRNAPEGEDIKKIKEIIKRMNREVVTVQEFVGLISPYTGDNGNVLRSVMVEDLANFRKMAKGIYDTMTQDVSDVLANQQINITEYYNERYTLHMDKMMRTIDEIYRYVPNFDFEKYYTDPNYLSKLFPLPKGLDTLDPDEMEMQKRQAAYHRLQWMRSEGIRLNEENVKLKARLKQLKKQQKIELMESRMQEQNDEDRTNELQNTQAKLQNRLEDLKESMERSIIHNEKELRMMNDTKLTRIPQTRPPSNARKIVRKKEPWNVKVAKSIEEQGLKDATDSAVSSISVTSNVLKTGTVSKKARPKIRKRPSSNKRDKRDVSPFHYSPPKTPPGSSRDQSPFHYSPPRSPPETRIPSKTVRIEGTTTVVQEIPPDQEQRTFGRRDIAPKDTWRGFQ